MLCPEVWSFDSPGFHAQDAVNGEWNDAAKVKLFRNIERNYQMNQFVS